MATKKKRRGGMKRGHARTVSERIRQVMTRIKSVSIDGPQVMDFGDPTLREAFRLWWHPYNMGPDFDELTGQAGQVIERAAPAAAATAPSGGSRPSTPSCAAT